MEHQEWLNLGEAIKHCVNPDGGLQYDYDGGFRFIEPFSPHNKNERIFGRGKDYRTKSRMETCLAIDEWIEEQRQLESTVLTTHAQLELEQSDKEAVEKIEQRLVEEKKVLVRGVVCVNEINEFPGWETPRPMQAKALFNVAVKAIEVFQEQPTALVLFPELVIHDSRVLGGFYGSPWSTFNCRTLKLKFRNLNPHFQISINTVWEGLRRPGRYENDHRKIGVLFTYANPW